MDKETIKENKYYIIAMLAVIFVLVIVTVSLSSDVFQYSRRGPNTSAIRQVNVDEFCKKIQGIWWINDENTENVLSTVEFMEKKVRFGVYPGSYEEGEITRVIQSKNGDYEVTIYYPEIVEADINGPRQEETVTLIVTGLKDDKRSFTYITGNGYSMPCAFVADNWADASAALDIMLENKKEALIESNIPTLALSSQVLNKDIYVLKIREELRQYDGINVMNARYQTHNTENLTCYIGQTKTAEFYCEKGGKVVLHCDSFSSAFGAQVKDLVPDDALYTAPAMYNADPYVAYVWKISNGYLSMLALPTSKEFYNHYVFAVIHTVGLDYLSFVG